MNWLAHLVLSKNNIDYQLGNILADPLKGKAWTGASHALIEGMAMHKAIDQFTDSHQRVLKSKARLRARGYLKGIVIDVLYDHFLSKHWQQFSECEFDDFMSDFHSNAFTRSREYPDEAKDFVSGLVESQRLCRYVRFEDFVTAVHRITFRLSDRMRERESMEQYISYVEKHHDDLESDFLVFFPDLIKLFKDHELGSASDHILN